MEMLSGAEMVDPNRLSIRALNKYSVIPEAQSLIFMMHCIPWVVLIMLLIRHEQAAVHMADGLARATGEVGRMVLVTSGQRGDQCDYWHRHRLYGFHSISCPFRAGSDLVDRLRCLQECDMVGISRPVVKHSFLVKQTEDIPQVLKKAFWLAASGRPGPVVVDLPKDILNPANKLPYIWPESVSMRSYNPTTTGHKGQIKRALQTLVAAKKPVVYVGGGAITAGCHQQLKETVEALISARCFLIDGAGGVSGNASSGTGHAGNARYLRSRYKKCITRM